MRKHTILTYLIAGVWLVNGFFCKLLGQAPRHEQIVALLLGESHAPMLTKLIGLGELMLAVWVMSGYRQKVCMLVQVILILTMNIWEQLGAVQLLLCGRFNFLFALLLILVILWHGYLHPAKRQGHDEPLMKQV